MLADKFVDLYARNSGLRDKLVAERDVVLTYALRALADTGVMKHLAFKGGTCLRKTVFGSELRIPSVVSGCCGGRRINIFGCCHAATINALRRRYCDGMRLEDLCSSTIAERCCWTTMKRRSAKIERENSGIPARAPVQVPFRRMKRAKRRSTRARVTPSFEYHEA
jgi:hypothetical protein